MNEECPYCDDGVAVVIVPGYDGEADIDFIKCKYCSIIYTEGVLLDSGPSYSPGWEEIEIPWWKRLWWKISNRKSVWGTHK